MANIVEFRAREIQYKTWVQGFHNVALGAHWITTMYLVDGVEMVRSYEVDPSTLSIHLPGMYDNHGEWIWSSLTLHGEGGSRLRGEQQGVFMAQGSSTCNFASEDDRIIWPNSYADYEVDKEEPIYEFK